MTDSHEAWRDEPLEALLRRVRDPGARIWKPACHELGRRVSSCADARAEMKRLLDCRYPEVRVRGVVAMSGAAEDCPEETVQLVRSSMADADSAADPLLMDATLALVAHLPARDARRVLQEAVEHPHEAVRGAAAASLPLWTAWPPEVLGKLARDASVFVRGSLALALPRLARLPETTEAVAILQQSPEPYVRALLEPEAVEVSPPEATAEEPSSTLGEGDADGEQRDPFLDEDPVESPLSLEDLLGEAPEPEVPESVARQVEQPPVVFPAIRAIDDVLVAHPHRAFQVLEPFLGRAGVLSLLDQVAALTREPVVARLCEALHRLLEESRESAPIRLRDVRAALAEQQGVAAETFRHRLDEAMAAVEAETAADVALWAGTVDVEPYRPLLEAISPLLEDDLLSVHAALGNLEALGGCPDPRTAGAEQVISRMVIERWIEVLDLEIQNRIAGVDS